MFGKCKGGGRRSAPRDSAPLIAVFSSVTRSDRAVVVDFSETGVRLRGYDLPDAGELVELRIETTRTFGITMWSNGRQCGIAFDEPLSPDEIHALRENARAAAGLAPQVKAALDDWMTGFAR
jgi:hypothetical protein